MTHITEMGYATIGVSDLKAWAEFATTVLGLEVMPGDNESSRILRMDYWHHRITLVEEGSDDILSIGYRVAGVEEFRGMFDKLKSAGIEVRGGTADEARARRVLDVMFLTDPNGFAIEVFHGPLVCYDTPFHPGRRMHGSFLTGENGFGHCLQNRVAGFDEIHAFYTLLGMRGATGYKMPIPGMPEPVELYFFDCHNQRQHTLAFGPPSKKRANHIMLEVEKMEDVGLAYDLVKQNGIPVIIEPGCHANDQMFSFYFKNPSGFMTEIGYGGRSPTGKSEYHERDSFGHAPVMENMGGFMVPA